MDRKSNDMEMPWEGKNLSLWSFLCLILPSIFSKSECPESLYLLSFNMTFSDLRTALKISI